METKRVVKYDQLTIGTELRCEYTLGGRGSVCKVVELFDKNERFKGKTRMLKVRFNASGVEREYNEGYLENFNHV